MKTRLIDARVMATILGGCWLVGCRPEAAPSFDYLFLSRRDGNGELYAMTRGDSVARNLTRDPGFDGFGAWSPDGRRIAFDSDRAEPGNRDIYVMDADGSNVRQLTRHHNFDFLAAWSPDGEQLAFVSLRDSEWDRNDPSEAPFAGEIYVIGVDGAGLRRLTHSPAHDQTPTWSPDGSAIVFSREVNGLGQLFIIAPDGNGERRLVESETFDAGPAYSPDGGRIAYYALRGDSAHLMVVGADGKHPERVAYRFAQNYGPAWSPDGRYLCYTVGVADQWDIYAVDLVTGEEFPLVTHEARDEACHMR